MSSTIVVELHIRYDIVLVHCVLLDLTPHHKRHIKKSSHKHLSQTSDKTSVHLGRSKAEGGEQVNEDEEEVQRVDNEVMNPILTAGALESTTRVDVAIVVEETNDERSSDGDVAKEPFQQVGQNWDCSQRDDELVERDAMDWLTDDEMMRQG